MNTKIDVTTVVIPMRLHDLVIETKSVRHKAHTPNVGSQLMTDVQLYCKYKNSNRSKYVVNDPYQNTSIPK